MPSAPVRALKDVLRRVIREQGPLQPGITLPEPATSPA
jgi:hypothetical protein